MESRRPLYGIYAALLVCVVAFFHKPLFSPDYLFPWDFRGVQLPPITYLADRLGDGQFPLWNPYMYNGFPVFANIESCYFQPFILLAAFIAAHTSLDALPMLVEWAVVLQIWLAGVAAFHLFGNLGARRPAAFAGAVIVETGGFFASRAEHIGAMMAVAWMPLAWLAVLHIAEARAIPRRWIAALSFAFGMAIVGGFPAAGLAVFVSACALAVLLVAFKMAPPRSLVWTALSCVFGVLLSAVQFFPTAQLTRHSVAQYRADYLGAGGGMYPQALVSLVLPNHYDIFDTGKFHGPGDITFLYLYCSLAGLLLAIYAVTVVRGRCVWLLAAMAAIDAFWMLGDKTAPWRWLYPLIPEQIRITIHPEYTYAIFTIAIAGLAALGLDRVRLPDSLRWAVAAIIAVDLFLVGAGRPMNLVSLKQEPGVTRDAFDGSRALLEGVRSRVNRDTPPSRIDTVDGSMFWAFTGAVTKIPSANGVSPMAPDRIIQLRLFLHDGARWGWYYPLEKLESPVLDLLNVRYVIASPKAAARLRALPRFRHVASLPGNELFENSTALPRFFQVHQVRVGAPLGDIDLRQTALVEEPIPLPPGNSGEDSVKIVAYEPENVDLEVKSRGNSVLIAADTHYPGWQAWVDDQPSAIHRVDLALRGVVVPDGTHRVRMEFRPTILWISIGITALTAAVLAWIFFRT